MRRASKTIREASAAIALLALAAAGWIYTGQLPSESAMFPRLSLIMLAAFSTAYLIRVLLKGAGNDVRDRIFTHWARFSVALALIVVYVLSFPYIGYFTATLVFVPLLATAMGLRRKVLVGIATLGFVGVTYGLFVLVFRRSLPDDLLLGLLG